MRAIVCTVALTLTATGCATSSGVIQGAEPGISFAGGDGSSCGSRVAIKGAKSAESGVEAEWAWIHQKYPGYRLQEQSMIDCQDRPTDRITITNFVGKERTLYFDISDFYRKDFVRFGS